MPTLHSNAKVEDAEGDLESAVAEDIKQFAKIPELGWLVFFQLDDMTSSYQEGNLCIMVCEGLTMLSCSVPCRNHLKRKIDGEDQLLESVFYDTVG